MAKDLEAAPKNLNATNVKRNEAFRRKIGCLFALISDEYSMKSRKRLAWEEY